jgi:branched-chain amino acid transport system substrate-binding protein
MGEAAIDKVKAIYRWHPNLGDSTEAERVAEYQRRFRSNYLGLPTATLFGMLAAAIEQAHTDEPMRVAQALEDMHYRTSLGEVWMRPQDHQLFAPMFVYTFTRVNGDDVRFDFEDTGIGTRTDIRLEPQSTVLPTRCKMRRPTLH